MPRSKQYQQNVKDFPAELGSPERSRLLCNRQIGFRCEADAVNQTFLA